MIIKAGQFVKLNLINEFEIVKCTESVLNDFYEGGVTVSTVTKEIGLVFFVVYMKDIVEVYTKEEHPEMYL